MCMYCGIYRCMIYCRQPNRKCTQNIPVVEYSVSLLLVNISVVKSGKTLEFSTEKRQIIIYSY